VDAMTGQAANLTRTFHEQMVITGCHPSPNWMEIAVAGRHYRCGGLVSQLGISGSSGAVEALQYPRHGHGILGMEMSHRW